MMLHVSYQLRNVRLAAYCWKTQNSFQMIISQLIASDALVQFHLWDSLFTAVGASKHAGVKKCIVFQIKQEAQLMLTTGSTRLAVSRCQQTWYHSTCYI